MIGLFLSKKIIFSKNLLYLENETFLILEQGTFFDLFFS